MLPAAATAPDLLVLTQNIRLALPGTRVGDPDHWPTRAPALQDLLRRAGADVIGLQEVLPEQIPVLAEVLGRTHRRIGYGREGGSRGEHSLLWLRRDRFAVRAWDQIWLAEEPRLIGSLGWDAHCPRILVHARVEDLRTGHELVIAVTHLDHAGETARREGARLIARHLREQAGDLPVLLMGDLNAPAGDAVWAERAAGSLADSHDVGARRVGEDLGTFPDYAEPVVGGERIDGILTRGLRVAEVATHVHWHGSAWASDHAAVLARVRVAGAEAGD